MNMKSLSVVLGAFAMLALGACKVTTTGSSSTGEGGSGAGTTTTGGVGGGGVGGGGGGGTSTATGTGGAPACDPKYTCSEAITPPDGDPTKLCDMPSGLLYDALKTCTCEGNCKTDCGDNKCAGKAITDACTKCVQSSVGGCNSELVACSSDAP